MTCILHPTARECTAGCTFYIGMKGTCGCPTIATIVGVTGFASISNCFDFLHSRRAGCLSAHRGWVYFGRGAVCKMSVAYHTAIATNIITSVYSSHPSPRSSAANPHVNFNLDTMHRSTSRQLASLLTDHPSQPDRPPILGPTVTVHCASSICKTVVAAMTAAAIGAHEAATHFSRPCPNENNSGRGARIRDGWNRIGSNSEVLSPYSSDRWTPSMSAISTAGAAAMCVCHHDPGGVDVRAMCRVGGWSRRTSRMMACMLGCRPSSPNDTKRPSVASFPNATTASCCALSRQR